MDTFINFLTEHAAHAHWIIFGSLILAGFNLPISEDLMIITSGILASTIIPEKTIILYAAVFLGCFLSDIILYWIGRSLGRKLWKIKWFYKTFPPKKLHLAQKFYQKHGFLTLLCGRFIPFGVRNCLFFTAGIGKMPFNSFLISDGIACFFSNTTLFCLTFFLGKNYQKLFFYIKKFNLFIFFVFIVTLICGIWYYKKKRKKGNNSSEFND